MLVAKIQLFTIKQITYIKFRRAIVGLDQHPALTTVPFDTARYRSAPWAEDRSSTWPVEIPGAKTMISLAREWQRKKPAEEKTWGI